jgi:uncharacterized protein (TIGR02145 family)
MALAILQISVQAMAQNNAPVPDRKAAATADSNSCGILEYGGQTYHTVIIGTQCWMKENLNIGKWVAQGQQGNQKQNEVLEKYCYQDDFTNCDLWGGLYEWDEMMWYGRTDNAQGICPEGWHIPSSDDWKTLVRFLGGNDVAGGPLKYTGSTGWQQPNVGANGSTGFAALPAGYYDTMAQLWHDAWRDAYFWSSETITKTTSVAVTLSYRKSAIDLYEEYNPSALSVRCIRNK